MKFLGKSVSLLIVSLLIVQPANASHRSSGVDRSSLDDDVVDTFPIPVLFGVELEDVNPDFGDPRDGGTRFHEGEDFLAPQGTPIVSPTEAIVIRTGEGTSAGKYVYTANPGGETFRYMHLDEISDIKRGDTLDVGDFIGTVGDTGNAPDGVYHLHFEVRDEDNKATDPFERLDDAFTIKQKMSFVNRIFRDIDDIYDEDDYAEFLVTTFQSDFNEALAKRYSLPDEIEDALEDSGAGDKVELLEKLQKLIKTIPSLVTTNLAEGDQGVAVSLLQTFLIFNSEGPARDRLSSAGATSYYGSITTAAMLEYQTEHRLKETGQYDGQTRAEMMD